MTLVIMAAGMGSRFGGLKQIEPIGPNGEFIIDYSIYDAIKRGFNKVIFIIKEENYSIFKSTIGKRFENLINVEYVFQSNDILSEEVRNERTKPLGTAHAILCAKELVKDNFAVINADDFYGSDAYRVVSEFLKNNKSNNEYSVISYNVENTITENGSVKRGICEVKDGYLTKIIESKIEIQGNKFLASPLDNTESFVIESGTKVSMNMFGFTPSLFKYLEKELEVFLNNADLLKDEFLLPNVVEKLIKSNEIKVHALNTISIWHGMTYKEDKEYLVDSIQQLINSGEYPSKLTRSTKKR